MSRCAALLARPVEEGWFQGATTRLTDSGLDGFSARPFDSSRDRIVRDAATDRDAVRGILAEAGRIRCSSIMPDNNSRASGPLPCSPQPHFAPAWPFSTLPSGLRLRVGVCLEAITELEGHRREPALHRGVVVGVAVTAGDPVRRNSRREQGRRARLLARLRGGCGESRAARLCGICSAADATSGVATVACGLRLCAHHLSGGTAAPVECSSFRDRNGGLT